MVYIEVEFRNTGYSSPYGWKTELVVRASFKDEDSFYLSTGKETGLARIIERYIIGEKFLWTGKRIMKKKLSERKWLLLKALKEAGSKYCSLYFTALAKKMSQKDLEAQIFWRIL